MQARFTIALSKTRPSANPPGSLTSAGCLMNFRQALDFTNRVGELAEEQNHQPDLYLSWGKVQITIWTHKIDGLTESDFVFAAKADQRLGTDATEYS